MQENLEVTILVDFNVLKIETFHSFWNRKVLHVSEIKRLFFRWPYLMDLKITIQSDHTKLYFG